jgi:hypothetical protein
MNEKIKNLALKCEFDVDQIIAEVLCPEGEDLDIIHEEWNKLPKETRHSIVSLLEERQKKFAELLIEECVTACEKNSWMLLNGHRRSTQIKEHFGVK